LSAITPTRTSPPSKEDETEKTRISDKRGKRGPLFAAVALSALYGGAAHPAAVATYSFQATGEPGSTIQYFPYPQPGFLEASVTLNSHGLVDATVGGTDVIMDFSSTDDSTAAILIAAILGGGSLYSQTLSGSGSLTIDDTSYEQLGSASLSGGVIYATLGASTATIVLGVNNYSGVGAEGGPPTGYLVLQGATTSPVSLVTTNSYPDIGDSLPYFNQFSLDWTVTYQSAPYVPTSSNAVPELSTWAMLALGFAGLGLGGWARRARATDGWSAFDPRRRKVGAGRSSATGFQRSENRRSQKRFEEAAMEILLFD
jgi:hypothetical protein